MLTCPLCNGESKDFCITKKRKFYRCNNCDGIFVPNKFKPSFNKEFERYKYHENDINDVNYQRYVYPLVQIVKENINLDKLGLDYGAGPGPVVTYLLSKNNYRIDLYDPYFHKNEEIFNNKYDFIICCEVVEHFHYPYKEFKKLKKLLKKNGKLFIMTNLYNDNYSFKGWSYKEDITHVFFYTEKTFKWIEEKFNFNINLINNNIIYLENM